MPCACGQGKKSAQSGAKTYTVTAPGGVKKTFRTKSEAQAAAARLGGSWKEN